MTTTRNEVPTASPSVEDNAREILDSHNKKSIDVHSVHQDSYRRSSNRTEESSSVVQWQGYTECVGKPV